MSGEVWRSRAAALIPGGSSTGSKRPEAIYGSAAGSHATHYMTANGCRITTTGGQELVDCTMALGSVVIGYADPDVTEAVTRAVRAGPVSGLAHVLEVEVAERLVAVVPCAERVRFLKTGAEGVAAAVRAARAHTGRDVVLGCGYFGWLDWSSDAAGVPAGVRGDFRRVRFDDAGLLADMARAAGARLAAVVIEPVIEREPSVEWLRTARELCDELGAVLIFDEIKTGMRLAAGGYQERSGIIPDLAVFAKALANGFPLAAVVGSARVMSALEQTWVSSTLAGESSALAAAQAVLGRHEREDVCASLAQRGQAMRAAVERALARSGFTGARVSGLPEMWFLHCDGPEAAGRFVALAATEGVLFKRDAYNFPSLAHGPAEVEQIERAALAAFERLREEEQ